MISQTYISYQLLPESSVVSAHSRNIYLHSQRCQQCLKHTLQQPYKTPSTWLETDWGEADDDREEEG